MQHTTSPLDSLRVPDGTYADTAYQKLKAAIVAGLLRPGQPLAERELVSRMGISRTPVREALQRLAADGLVDLAAHKGGRVRILSLDEAREAYEVRMALEGAAAKFAAERAPAEQLEHIRSVLLPEMEQAENGSLEAISANDEFHRQIARLSGNTALLAQVSGVLDRIALWRNGVIDSGVRYRSTWEEHRSLIDLMINRDGNAARAAMETHIEKSWRNSTNT